MFFHRGLVLKRPDSDKVFLCLGAVGGVMVLAWEIEQVTFPDNGITTFVVGGNNVVNEKVIWLPTLTFDDYLSIPVKAISPVHYYIILKRNIDSTLGVVYLKTGDYESIIETGARACFWDLNMKSLKILADDRGVKASGPALLDVLEPLIKNILPDLSEQDLTNILQLRGIKMTDPVAAIIDGENLEDVLEPDQLEDLAEHVASKEIQARESLVHRAAVKARASKEPKARKKPTPHAVQQVVKGKKDIDFVVAEQMKPPHTVLYDAALNNRCSQTV